MVEPTTLFGFFRKRADARVSCKDFREEFGRFAEVACGCKACDPVQSAGFFNLESWSLLEPQVCRLLCVHVQKARCPKATAAYTPEANTATGPSTAVDGTQT